MNEWKLLDSLLDLRFSRPRQKQFQVYYFIVCTLVNLVSLLEPLWYLMIYLWFGVHYFAQDTFSHGSHFSGTVYHWPQQEHYFQFVFFLLSQQHIITTLTFAFMHVSFEVLIHLHVSFSFTITVSDFIFNSELLMLGQFAPDASSKQQFCWANPSCRMRCTTYITSLRSRPSLISSYDLLLGQYAGVSGYCGFIFQSHHLPVAIRVWFTGA